MQYKQNLHTHTTYCDGKHTPEEMIRYAIGKGFDSLGFSGHSHMLSSPSRIKAGKGMQQYKTQITALKQKYQGTFKIYLGLEVDICFDTEFDGFDYLIGSVHYLNLGGERVGFDKSADAVRQLIDSRFDGNGMKFAEKYYQTVSELPRFADFDIIGHFDLITKNLDQAPLFDLSAKTYLGFAYDAIHALKGRIPFFEVNTGAIARGYRTTPYPSIPLLQEFKNLGFGAIITSDCHDGRFLDCCFEDARSVLKVCGFKERYILTDTGFEAVPI